MMRPLVRTAALSLCRVKEMPERITGFSFLQDYPLRKQGINTQSPALALTGIQNIPGKMQ